MGRCDDGYGVGVRDGRVISDLLRPVVRDGARVNDRASVVLSEAKDLAGFYRPTRRLQFVARGMRVRA